MKVGIKNDFVLRVKMLYSAYILCIYSPSPRPFINVKEGAGAAVVLVRIVFLLVPTFSFLFSTRNCLSHIFLVPLSNPFYAQYALVLFLRYACIFCLCRAFYFFSLHVLIRISLAAETIDFAFWIEYSSFIATSQIPLNECGIFSTFNKVFCCCYCCCFLLLFLVLFIFVHLLDMGCISNIQYKLRQQSQHIYLYTFHMAFNCSVNKRLIRIG